MCYETVLSKGKVKIEKRFNSRFMIDFEYEPYYHRSAFGYPNLYIIKMDEPNAIYPSTWGFVPEFALENLDQFRKKYNTYNAKSETILTSGTYKKSAREKRCLIIADGFFEPHHQNKVSIPYFCYQPTKEYEDGRDLFVFAGLYSTIEEKDKCYSCTIITKEANPFFAEVHNQKKRMPLVLNEEFVNEWLTDGLTDTQIQEIMLLGFTQKEFKAHPVSRDLYKRNLDTNNPDILKEVDNGTLI